MTNKEKAIIMAYTGICMLAGDKFRIFHKYVEDIMGRPIYTHEIGLLADTIKEKAEADFMALCADESSSEIPNKCEDAISRAWLKEAIHNFYYGLKHTPTEEDIQAYIDAAPPVTPQQKMGRWIPVSERLPEDGQNVLFCDTYGYIMVGYHIDGRPNTHFSQDGTYEGMKNVKAWMPLPEPYEQRKGEE